MRPPDRFKLPFFEDCKCPRGEFVSCYWKMLECTVGGKQSLLQKYFGCGYAKHYKHIFQLGNVIDKPHFKRKGCTVVNIRPFKLRDFDLFSNAFQLEPFVKECEKLQDLLPRKDMFTDLQGGNVFRVVQEQIRNVLGSFKCNAITRLLQAELYDVMPSNDEQLSILPSIDVYLPFQLKAVTVPTKLQNKRIHAD